MEVRHIKIDDVLSVMVNCDRITVNAISNTDGTGLSFSLPPDLSKQILDNCASDAMLASVCYPIGVQLQIFELMMRGNLYSICSPEDAQENFSIMSEGLNKTNTALHEATLRRIKETKDMRQG